MRARTFLDTRDGLPPGDANPLQSGDLIHICIIAFRFFRMFLTKCGKSKKTESSETVIEGD